MGISINVKHSPESSAGQYKNKSKNKPKGLTDVARAFGRWRRNITLLVMNIKPYPNINKPVERQLLGINHKANSKLITPSISQMSITKSIQGGFGTEVGGVFLGILSGFMGILSVLKEMARISLVFVPKRPVSQITHKSRLNLHQSSPRSSPCQRNNLTKPKPTKAANNKAPAPHNKMSPPP